MFNLLFRLCLTFNSISIFGIVYAVKTHLWIPGMGIYTMLIYILFLILFSLLCLKLTNYLGKDSIEKIDNIEIGAESYMAVYLGYFLLQQVCRITTESCFYLCLFCYFCLHSFLKRSILTQCFYY